MKVERRCESIPFKEQLLLKEPVNRDLDRVLGSVRERQFHINLVINLSTTLNWESQAPYQVQREFTVGSLVHFFCPEDLGEPLTASNGKIPAVSVDLLFTSKPLAEVESCMNVSSVSS